MEPDSFVFGVCRSALTEAIKQAVQQRHAEMEKVLQDFEDKPVDYRDPVTRFAYLRSNVPFMAMVIARIIENSQENLKTGHDLASLFEGGHNVDVASVGCGPGSDMLGVVKYCLSLSKNVKLGWNLYDDAETWESTLRLVQKELDTVAGDLLKYTNFHQWDLAKDNGDVELKRSHLYIFSMVLSDIFRCEDESMLKQVETNLKHCFENAAQGAYFLFVDNMGPEDSKKMTALMNRVFGNGDVCQEFYRYFDFELPEEEQLEAKSEWRKAAYFGEKEEPKFMGKIFYYLYKKV